MTSTTSAARDPGSGGEPRIPLTRERVLGAAIDLADASGIEALTMRRLAQALGVEAMTLYHYVDRKDDLRDRIVDIVVSEIELPPAGTHWKVAVRTTAVSAHAVLMRHKWAAGQMLSVRVRPARLRYMNSILGSLREGGFSPAMTHHAYHALDSHILGFTLWVVGIGAASEDLPGLAGSFLESLPVNEYPWLAEHIEQHLGPRPDEISEFEFGLDLILDGLERLKEAS